MSIEIRKAKKEDLRRVAQIYAEGFGEKPYSEGWTEETALKRIGQYFKMYEMFVSLADKKIVGFIIVNLESWYDGNWLRIWEIVIDKKYRGKGVGSALMKQMEEEYSKKNKVIRTILETHRKSDAFNFYKHRNYKETDWILVSKDL